MCLPIRRWAPSPSPFLTGILGNVLPGAPQGGLSAYSPPLGAEAQRGKDTHVLALGGSTRQGAPCQRTRLLALDRLRRTRYGRDMLGEGGIAPR